MTSDAGSAREQAALRRVAEATARATPPEEVFGLVAAEICELFGAQSGVLWRLEDDVSVVIGTAGEPPGRIGTRFALGGEGAVPSVARNGAPVRVSYDDLPHADPTRRRMDGQGFRWGIAAPVIAEGRLWGAILAARTHGDDFAPGDEERLGHFASLVGLAIANASDRERLDRRVREHEAFGRLAAMIARSEPRETVLRGVAGEVGGLLDLEVGAVGRYEDGAAVLEARWSKDGIPFPGGGALDHVPLEEDTVLTRIHRTGAPARVDDYRALDNSMARAVVASGVLSSVGAPVFVNGSLWGAVVATSPRADAIPEDAEERLLRFSELAGVAVASAEQRSELERRAATDPLTRLPNHRVFHERLGEELERARRHGRPLALAIMDLDHFKRVNDRFGHHVGDDVLREASRRLASQARTGDLIARVGGEEFAWILPDCDALDAWQAVERARALIAETPFATAGAITISAGVCDIGWASDPAGLFRLADQALYWAKSSGRNLCFRYAPEVERAGSPGERIERLGRAQMMGTMLSLARIVDAKHSSTSRHSERVADLAVRLGTALGWEAERLTRLREAGLLHDVGKIGIPDAVLYRPGRLSEEELAQVRLHPSLGAEIVSSVLDAEQVAWLRAHHERMDGTGYPDALTAHDIPQGGRVLAVAEAWDAMTRGRPHAAAISADAAIAEVRRCAGGQFCPEVVEALERLSGVGLLTGDAGPP